jgi:16S rRNA U1498 N3-methylase RsmE
MLKTFVNTVDGRIMVLEKILGNAIKTAYGIVGAKTIGHGKDSTLGLLYNFIKGNNHDYIIEYNTETGVSEIVAQSSTGTRLNFKPGERITNVDIIENDAL